MIGRLPCLWVGAGGEGRYPRVKGGKDVCRVPAEQTEQTEQTEHTNSMS